MMMKTTILSVATMCLFAASTLAFAPVSTSINSRANLLVQQQPFVLDPVVASTTTSTQLQEGKSKYGYQGTDDGMQNGIVIQVIVFGLCAWMFTIPPEFRRAHFCNDNEPPSAECMTADQWVGGVKDYYANGGGIKWDFSIDPKTKAANQQKLDAFLNNMNKGGD